LIKQKRQASQNVLVLDAGNWLVGDQNPALQTQGRTSIEALNRMGYDAAALGPKDLELGPEVIKQRVAEAEFPVLSANALDTTTDSLLTKPFTILEFGQHRVAIVGISGLSTSAVIQIRDPLQTAKATVSELAERADIIIVLSNAGQAVNQAIASQIPGIDLVIGAGGEVTPQNVEAGGGLLLQADKASRGHAGRFVGVADMEFNSQGDLVGTRWEIVGLSSDIPNDPDLAAWMAQQQ